MLISRWWEGPLWLRESPEYWPLGETPGDSEEVELERKKLKVVNIDLSRDAPPWHLYAISDYSKMIRVFSWILRFVNNCTLLNGKCKDSELSQSEIENSEKKLIRLVQSYYLPDAKSSNYIETYIDDEVEETRTPKILWKFIPPTAAWWGGWWEKLVRTVKELLKRTLGRSVLKYDELYTVLCDCESIINCRPLTYVSENPEELIPLTPSMFLISNKNSNIEDIEELNSNSLNKRIKYRSKLLKDLRQRFRNEYLSQLIQKHNEKESRDPQIGEVVLVGDDNKKRLFGALAKIIELIPGRDGKIRTVRLKTQHGKFLRPIQRIYPLEIRSNENLQRGLEESITTVSETLSPDENNQKIFYSFLITSCPEISLCDITAVRLLSLFALKIDASSGMNSYEISIRNATRKIVTTVHPGMSISSGALHCMHRIMSQLNEKIIKACLKNNPKGKQTEMREEIAQKAVEEELPQQLKTHATVNAHRYLTKYRTGLLVYKPKLLRTFTHKKKKTKKVAEHFMKVVQALAERVSPEIKLDKDAKEMNADIMQQMCKILVEKTNSVAQDKDVIEARDIIKSIDYFMPAIIAKYAISEGVRNALQFMSGLSNYKPEDFNPQSLRKLTKKYSTSFLKGTPKK
ncbi:integrase catalytic domain-containing protein [Trichonephila clavipes]|nr:integrase catalytic domain-containing protein [Trichonephila clavipes]